MHRAGTVILTSRTDKLHQRFSVSLSGISCLFIKEYDGTTHFAIFRMRIFKFIKQHTYLDVMMSPSKLLRRYQSLHMQFFAQHVWRPPVLSLVRVADIPRAMEVGSNRIIVRNLGKVTYHQFSFVPGPLPTACLYSF